MFQVEHEPFVEFVQKYFVDMKPTWHSEENVNSSPKKPLVDKSIAQYTGGLVQVRFIINISFYVTSINLTNYIIILK